MGKLKNAYGKAPALFSLILCFTIVIVSALVYLGVGLLPRSARIFDVTQKKLYTLHSETLNFLSELDRDVEIILVSESGIPEYGTPEVLMRSYAEKNKRISLSVVSPDEVYATYGALNEGCAVVRCGEKETVIYSSDYFDLTADAFDNSYNTYYYLSQQGYDLGSYSDFMYSGYGERLGLFDIAKYQSTITNAIRYVTSDKITTIYALTDHGEAMLDVYLYPELRMNSTELLFGKLSDGIPAETDGVLINNPTSDLTEADKTALAEYLSRGGKLTVTTSYTNIKKLPNLLSVCEEYGLTTDGGFLCEDDNKFNYNQYPLVTVPTINAEAFGGYLTADGLKPIITGGTGITVTEKEGVKTVSLLATSPNAYSKQDAEKEGVSSDFNSETDKRMQYSVAALAKKEADGSSILWIPTFTLSDSLYDTASSRNNFPVFVAALNTQYGSVEPIEIPGVSLAVEPLSVPENAFTVGMVFAILIPCAILGFGAFSVYRRRR